jgi:hypothetical protein
MRPAFWFSFIVWGCFSLTCPFLGTGMAQEESEKKEKKEKGKTRKPAADEPAEPKEDEAGGAEAEETEKKPAAAGKRLTPDEQYVQTNLKDYLHPTAISFLPDGRVKMTFDFSAKSPDHVQALDPPIQALTNSAIRWTLPREETYFSVYGDSEYGPGLRLSDAGATHIRCWFKDDVEAEMIFVSGTSASPANVMALVYTNEKGDSIGSNLGAQAGMFTKGKQRKKKGETEKVTIYTATKIKLAVRGEVFEAQGGAARKESLPYARKNFPSGRVGFVWGGKVAGMVPTLTITGRLDVEKMKQELRKKTKG